MAGAARTGRRRGPWTTARRWRAIRSIAVRVDRVELDRLPGDAGGARMSRRGELRVVAVVERERAAAGVELDRDAFGPDVEGEHLRALLAHRGQDPLEVLRAQQRVRRRRRPARGSARPAAARRCRRGWRRTRPARRAACRPFHSRVLPWSVRRSIGRAGLLRPGCGRSRPGRSGRPGTQRGRVGALAVAGARAARRVDLDVAQAASRCAIALATNSSTLSYCTPPSAPSSRSSAVTTRAKFSDSISEPPSGGRAAASP